MGNCAEAGSWRKSSFSAAGNCVEAGTGARVTAVRDTQQADLAYRVTLEFPVATWREFTDRVKAIA